MSSTPLDSFVLWTRRGAEALSKAPSSIMHVGLIRTLTALKKPTAIEWQRSHLFFSFDSRCMRKDLMCHSVSVDVCVCVCTRAQVSANVHECAGAIRNMLLDNSLGFTHKLSQLRASWSVCVWVTVLMSSFHAVLRSLARWSCTFSIFLLQICVLEYMCRIKPLVVGRWGIHTNKGELRL